MDSGKLHSKKAKEALHCSLPWAELVWVHLDKIKGQRREVVAARARLNHSVKDRV
jgi:hypothetical protein